MEIKIKKIKFKVQTWEKGQELIKNISNFFPNIVFEERNSDQIICNKDFKIRIHPDDRGFVFISCKVYNTAVFDKLEQFLDPFHVKK